MFFREGDVFILDKGCRDVIESQEELNVETHWPESASATTMFQKR